MSFPSRNGPVGLPEDLNVVAGPSNIQSDNNVWRYRFSVKQTIAKIGGRTYDFDLYADGTGKICFVGQSCSPRQ